MGCCGGKRAKVNKREMNKAKRTTKTPTNTTRENYLKMLKKKKG